MDRRRQPRVRTEGEIKVRILASGKLSEGQLVDLNNAGAFVATDLVLEKGEKVHLELDIPGDPKTQPLPSGGSPSQCRNPGASQGDPRRFGLGFRGAGIKRRKSLSSEW